ncbi:hypothetical protein ANO11243_079520 [Dothideomycetidae sp. 11243]|nr:hypothetical protein ANO11243_079520 [fungal sp. No.11243]
MNRNKHVGVTAGSRVVRRSALTRSRYYERQAQSAVGRRQGGQKQQQGEAVAQEWEITPAPALARFATGRPQFRRASSAGPDRALARTCTGGTSGTMVCNRAQSLSREPPGRHHRARLKPQNRKFPAIPYIWRRSPANAPRLASFLSTFCCPSLAVARARRFLSFPTSQGYPAPGLFRPSTPSNQAIPHSLASRQTYLSSTRYPRQKPCTSLKLTRARRTTPLQSSQHP